MKNSKNKQERLFSACAEQTKYYSATGIYGQVVQFSTDILLHCLFVVLFEVI